MPNPFESVSFAKYTPTYVGAPLEQFAKTAEVLNQRYEENKDSMDQLDIAMSNIPVEDADTPILKARLDKTRDIFKSTLDKGDFENAGNVVKTAFKEFATDGAVKAASDNYNIRQKTKAELRDAYEKGTLSATQYADRTRRFNQYDGIGSPDELGFYNKYDFDMGAKRVDLDEFAAKALHGYKADTTSKSGTGVNYSSAEEQLIGIASSQTTNQVQISNGTRGKFVLEDQLKNNPDAMAYIQDEVRIHNENNPDNPITTDQFIDDYAMDYVKRYNSVDSATATVELRERDAFKQKMYESQATQQEGVGGVESIPLMKDNPYGNDKILQFIEGKARKDKRSTDVVGLPFTINDIFGGLNSDQQQQYNTLKTSLGSDEAVRLYLQNVKKTGVSETYRSFTPKVAADNKAYLINNFTGRKVYSLKDNKVIDGAEFQNKVLGAKGADWGVAGVASTNNTYLDFTNDASFAMPYIIQVNGEPYAVSLSKGEMDMKGLDFTASNQLTKSYRSGTMQPMINPRTRQEFKVRYLDKRSIGGAEELMIYDKQGRGVGSVPYTGNDQLDLGNFYKLTENTK